MRIALLDDDRHHLEFVTARLTEAGFSCHTYLLTKDLLFDLRRESYDLLLIDWLMPDISGLDALKQIRQQNNLSTPVIFLTARDAEADVVEALEAGADDYVVKPIRTGELIARVRALLRRTMPQPEAERIYEMAGFRFDTRTQQSWRDDRQIELTQKEFQLALLLLRNLGRPLSRGHIREMVWGRGTEVPSRTMDTHVSRVRTKLDLRPEHGFLLAPVYSYGYRLEQLDDKGQPKDR